MGASAVLVAMLVGGAGCGSSTSAPEGSAVAPPSSAPGSTAGAAERACGGMMPGPGCAETEYCHFELDAICGAADQTGVCRPRPTECPGGEPPVCGCNDQSFPSACEAHRFGVSVQALGACGPPI